MEIDKEIAVAHLKAAGWDLGVFNGFNPFDCHFVYINDFDNGAVQLVSIAQKDFEAVVLHDQFTASELAYLISDKYLKNNSKDVIFVPALVGYIKKTKAFAQWRLKHNSSRLHFIINIYGSKTSTTPWLRPFIPISDDIIIHSEEMLDLSKFVHTSDQENNPTWFGRKTES